MSKKCNLLLPQVKRIKVLQIEAKAAEKELDFTKMINDVAGDKATDILRSMTFITDKKFLGFISKVNKSYKSGEPILVADFISQLRNSGIDFKTQGKMKMDLVKDVLIDNGEMIVFDVMDQKLFDEIISDMVNQTYHAADIAIENPLTRIINGMVTLNKHYDAVASEALTKAIGFPEGIQKAYTSGDQRAKAMIDGLWLKGGDVADIDRMVNHFDKIFDALVAGIYKISNEIVQKGDKLTGMTVKVDGKVFTGVEAIKYMKSVITESDKAKIMNKLLRVGNQKDYGEKMIFYKTEKKSLGWDNKNKKEKFRYRTTKVEGRATERTLFMDEMIEKNIDVSFMNIGKTNMFKSLILPSSINGKSMIDTYMSMVRKNNPKLKDWQLDNIFKKIEEGDFTLGDIINTKVKAKNKQYQLSFDSYAEVVQEVNNNTVLGRILRSQLGIPNDKIIAGSFGDKGGTIQLYSYPELAAKIKKDNSNMMAISEELLQLNQIEYSLKMGFRDTTSMKWPEFQIQLNKEIKKNPEGSVQRTMDHFTKKYPDTPDLFGIGVNHVNKREASSMSKMQVFKGLVHKIYVYLMTEYVDPDFIPFQNMISKFTGDKPAKFTLEEMENLFMKIEKLDPDVKNSVMRDVVPSYDKLGVFQEKESLGNVLEYMQMNYFMDHDDGFSVTSRGIAEMREKVMGGKPKNANKDHMRFVDDDIAFMVKTLFNKKDVYSVDGKPMEGQFAGRSSAKLGKNNYDPIDEFVYIDGERRQLIGKKETTTGSVVDAESDSYKVKDEIVLPYQLMNKVSYAHRLELEEYLTKEVEAVFKEVLEGFGDSGVGNVLDSGINDDIIASILAKTGVGKLSDYSINAPLMNFLDKAHQIITKPEIAGTSVTMTKSRRYIEGRNGFTHKLGRNEIIVSKDNPVAKAEIKKQRDIFEKALEEKYEKPIKEIYEDKEIPKEFKTLELEDIYVATYRNPIPNTENFGVMKLVFVEDLKASAKRKGDMLELEVGHDMVITHPENTFLKLQADHDGDHMGILSIDSEIGDIVARSVLEEINPELIKNLGGDRVVKHLRAGTPYKNDLIIIKQATTKKAVNKKPEMNVYKGGLLQKRMAALEAKETISIVMGTVRSLDVVQQLHDGWKSGKLTKRHKEYIIDADLSMSSIGEGSIEGFFTRFGLTRDSEINKKEFRSISSQISQDVIDFGSSEDITFNRGWIENLMKTFNPEFKGTPDFFETITNLNKMDKVENFKINKIVSKELLPGIKGSLANLINDKYQAFLKDHVSYSQKEFMYEEYMQGLFGHKPLAETKDIVMPEYFAFITQEGGLKKPMTIETFYNMLKTENSVYINNKTKLPQEYLYFKTNLKGSIEGQGNDSITNFAIFKQMLNDTVEKITDYKWLKENNIAIKGGVRTNKLKDIWNDMDDLNLKIEKEEIKRGDLVGDEDFVKSFNDLDNISKKFVISRLIAEGHNRFAGMLSVQDKGKFMTFSQINSGDRINRQIKEINNSGIPRTPVTETIIVDFDSMENIKNSKAYLDETIKVQEIKMNQFIKENPEIMDIINQAPGNTPIERMDYVIKNMQSECM